MRVLRPLGALRTRYLQSDVCNSLVNNNALKTAYTRATANLTFIKTVVNYYYKAITP